MVIKESSSDVNVQLAKYMIKFIESPMTEADPIKVGEIIGNSFALALKSQKEFYLKPDQGKILVGISAALREIRL